MNPAIQPLGYVRDMEVDPVEEFRQAIALGQALVEAPLILEFIRNEHTKLLHKVTHLQPAVETDRDVAFAFNTVNAKISLLEQLYSYAVELPNRITSYSEFIQNNQQSQE